MLKVDGKKLLDLMFERPIGVSELAKASGFAQSTISDLLNGNRRASIPTVAKLAKFFNVNPHDLILVDKKE